LQSIPTTAVTPADEPTHPAREPRGLTIAYAAFLLVAIGRVGDLVPGLSAVPLGKLAMAVALALLVSRWRQLPKLPAIAKPWTRTAMLLAVLAVLLTPLSIWPGASVAFLSQQLPVLLATVIISCKLPNRWPQLRTIGRVLIVCAIVMALAALESFRGGRATGSSSAYDPNDLAYMLVSFLPLALAFALNAKTRASRIGSAGVAGIMVIALLLTASRGGLLGLLAVLAFLVLLPIKRPRARPEGGKTRPRVIASLLGVLCLGAVIWPNLPAETRARLATVVALGNDYNADVTDRNSRSAIWERGFFAVLQRPIGYGADAFPMVDLNAGGTFRAPHNSYLEALVELGFLGLLLFLRIYVLAWRMLQKIRHTLLSAPPNAERDEVLVFARMLQVGLLGNAVAGFFLSMTYSLVLWSLLGAVITCASVARADCDALAPAPEQPAGNAAQSAGGRQASIEQGSPAHGGRSIERD
jgi:putative inorganic carbon (hco3(-)) transporter